MSSSFVHLHVHGNHSALDGGATIEDYAKKAAADGQPAIALTDHGNLHGLPDLERATRKHGLKMIPGCELYTAYRDVSERPKTRNKTDSEGEVDKRYMHLTTLAYNQAGYHNLIKLSSRAFLDEDSFYFKPRVDFDILSDHSEGIITTSSCLGGQVLQDIMKGNLDGARDTIGNYIDILGRDRYFIEVQNHDIPEQHKTNPVLFDLAKEFGLRTIAAGDCHYLDHSDHHNHDVLLCVGTRSLVSDKNRFRFNGSGHHFMTADEIRSVWRDHPEVCDTTLQIADMVEPISIIGRDGYRLPHFPVPEGFDDDKTFLRHLVYEGARERYDMTDTKILERIEYELSVINNMGFAGYFLILWDVINFCESQGIMTGPGRGSAGSSVVSFCCNITRIDPLKYDLPFERFLNPNRVSMPDIDLDIDTRYRDTLINYCAEKYGRDHVAQIITFGFIKARSAIKDASRVLGYSQMVSNSLTKLVPPDLFGRPIPLEELVKADLGDVDSKYQDQWKLGDDFRKTLVSGIENVPGTEVHEILDSALFLEGKNRQTGVHAAAVVIGDEPLTNVLPLEKRNKSDDTPITTQYAMNDVEDLGLVKMDFLGLQNLDVISECLRIIKASTGKALDINDIPLDDPKTYEMLSGGGGIGVFQLESGPMRSLMKRLEPEKFTDIAALIALYRPGPMAMNLHNDYADRKNGRQEIAYPHPDSEEILSETLGVVCYQETIMALAQKYANYDPGSSYDLVKACLPGDTLMLTKDTGLQRLDSIVPGTRRSSFTIIDANNGSRFCDEVEDIWAVGEKDVYSIETSTGLTIKATSDHKFLDANQEWVPLSFFSEGDLIGTASKMHSFGGSKVSENQVILTALLLSEGYIPDDNTHAMYFCNTDKELLSLFSKACYEEFGFTPKAKVNKNVTYLNFNKKQREKVISTLGITPGLSGKKSVPIKYLNASNKNLELFLALYLVCDGWTDKRGVGYGSKSKKMIKDLKLMCARLGFTLTITEKNTALHGKHYAANLSQKRECINLISLLEKHFTLDQKLKTDKCRSIWEETIKDKACNNYGLPCNIVDKEIDRRSKVTGKSKHALGLTRPSSLKTSTFINKEIAQKEIPSSEKIYDLSNGDLHWEKISNIDYVGKENCYDFTMTNQDRPYAIANGFLVHNCAKKKIDLMAEHKEKFFNGCYENGHDKEVAQLWWDIIEPFSSYAFNLSHSIGYGLIAYQTAYLKANYHTEYFSAILESAGDIEKAGVFLYEAGQMGIEILPPDVNLSQASFSPEGSNIRFGLGGIKGIGHDVAEQIVEARGNSKFRSYDDMTSRLPTKVTNKKVIYSLAAVGALDTFGSRGGLLQASEDTVSTARRKQKEVQDGMVSFLDLINYDAATEIPEIDLEDQMIRDLEREYLGISLSCHPLEGWETTLPKHQTCIMADIEDEVKPEQPIKIAGYISDIKPFRSKRGNHLARLQIQDYSGTFEALVMPQVWESWKFLKRDQVVVCSGKLSEEGDIVICTDIRLLNNADIVQKTQQDLSSMVVLDLVETDMTETNINKFKEALGKYVSESSNAKDVIVNLRTPQGPVQIQLNDDFKILPKPMFYVKVKRIFNRDVFQKVD